MFYASFNNALTMQCLVAPNSPSVDDILYIYIINISCSRCLKCHKLWMLNDPCQSYVHYNNIFSSVCPLVRFGHLGIGTTRLEVVNK